MSGGGEPTPGGVAHTFGSCCGELKEALRGEDFEPLIMVGEDGVLYLSVGLVEVQDEDPCFVDHPLFFCPFCGANLQTAEEVKGKKSTTED